MFGIRFGFTSQPVNTRVRAALERRATYFELKAADIRRRLPSLAVRHPVPHRLALPRRYARGLPRTLLDRQRRIAAMRGQQPPYIDSIQRSAQRVRDAIRARLLALRNSLLAFRRRIGAY